MKAEARTEGPGATRVTHWPQGAGLRAAPKRHRIPRLVPQGNQIESGAVTCPSLYAESFPSSKTNFQPVTPFCVFPSPNAGSALPHDDPRCLSAPFQCQGTVPFRQLKFSKLQASAHASRRADIPWPRRDHLWTTNHPASHLPCTRQEQQEQRITSPTSQKNPPSGPK